MIYTTGYTGLEIEKLIKKVEELNAFLIDIRFKPWSKNLTWSQGNLIDTFGVKYYPAGKFFGNVNYTKPIEYAELSNFNGGVQLIKTMLKNHENLILMCMCKDRNECHRRIIARKLTEIGFEVEELSYKNKEPDNPTQLTF
jgi:uncharacterized protein (DUF488 family)